MSSNYFIAFDTNLKRVDSLIAIYDAISDKNTEKMRATDVLRAAVVFLHASQEDYYRSVLSDWLIVKAEPKVLKDVALANSPGRAQKITLQDLLPFAEQTVEEVLRESVRQAMSNTSFNRYSEICTWFRAIGVSLDRFKDQGRIEKLISRRHRIVHEVDLSNRENNGSKKTASLDKRTVLSWRKAVIELLTLIDEQVLGWR